MPLINCEINLDLIWSKESQRHGFTLFTSNNESIVNVFDNLSFCFNITSV